ncbi:anti-sigma factor family protein [Cytobacillus sp. NCCP-133]|uniref:anti-sigma factor family protein n=1 Tax=Cytobacillus sp. NCCP-133 TaxID=766848 RepID=UPI00222FC20A|nr:anti-sigma factor [Cytobacillus sp. NCCP-133]GLB62073.1 anti-sigma-W factor RsiW [Cytobacillus sp. NCCP-133]
MKCPAEIILYMHEYLDEEISAEHEKELRAHLQNCKECQNHFHELKKTIALVQSTSHIQAPDHFTASVMAKLPKERHKVGVQRWFRQHPLLTAASLFLILMMGSLISSWDQDHQLSVSKQPNLVVQNDKVIVPEGEVVKGDVVVKNGKLEIHGEIDGDVTVINGEVINGEQYMASAGKVTGEIEEVNAIFEWIWFHIKNASKEIINVFDADDKDTDKEK